MPCPRRGRLNSSAYAPMTELPFPPRQPTATHDTALCPNCVTLTAECPSSDHECWGLRCDNLAGEAQRRDTRTSNSRDGFQFCRIKRTAGVRAELPILSTEFGVGGCRAIWICTGHIKKRRWPMAQKRPG